MLLGGDTQFLPCHFQVVDLDAAPYPTNNVAVAIFLWSVKPAVPAVHSVAGAPHAVFKRLLASFRYGSLPHVGDSLHIQIAGWRRRDCASACRCAVMPLQQFFDP